MDFCLFPVSLDFDVANGNVIPETVEEQAAMSLKNLDAIMSEAGTSKKNVVKTTIFLTDMNDFAKVNEVYGEYFGEDKPARSCVAGGCSSERWKSRDRVHCSTCINGKRETV